VLKFFFKNVVALHSRTSFCVEFTNLKNVNSFFSEFTHEHLFDILTPFLQKINFFSTIFRTIENSTEYLTLKTHCKSVDSGEHLCYYNLTRDGDDFIISSYGEAKASM
jgi:hypothetical protein